MSSWHSRTYGASQASSRTAQDRKYTVGTRVRLLGHVADPRAKDRKTGLKDPWFQITQLLPAEHMGFQYRVKNVSSGLECVILENQIAADNDTGPAEQHETHEHLSSPEIHQ